MKVRNSNHELLRLAAMYMIIFIHANMYLNHFYTGGHWNLLNGIVNGICNAGVTCFVLISGYYGIKFNFKKLVKLECMLISYSLIETGILYLVFPEQMQGTQLLEQLVKSVFPFISRKYWFYSCYLCLFLLSGFLDKIIEKLSQTDFKRLIFLCVFLFSVLPTVFYFEIVPDNGKGLVQMLMVYLIGRYLKLYHQKTERPVPAKKLFLSILILWGINGISHEHPIKLGGIYHHLCKDNSITNLAIAILLFLFFRELSFHSRLLNKASSYIFAAFALNNSFVTVIMTLLIKNGLQSTQSTAGFLILAGMVMGILLFCIIIGMIREALLGRCDNVLGEKLSAIGKKILCKYGEVFQ